MANVAEEYTVTERENILRKMRGARDLFYMLARDAGHHQFLEFAGLMGEYIILCEAAHREGHDFATGAPLPMRAHHARVSRRETRLHLRPRVRAVDPDLRGVFVHAFFGER